MTTTTGITALDVFVAGGIWTTTPVTQVPEIVLEDWAVFQLADGDRHFAGYNATEGEGRVSSKIVAFDHKTMRGVTSTGRVYQLHGLPGLRGDGAYVWERWQWMYNITEYTDISCMITQEA